ncbi:Pal1 cell morphology protein-domain-containing protein [Favolaschia claudopus]|uniref:Pal1 cell morphology protein-domain-containing protein n=1 Tax=Favolaschia claudopus TaxID=2862362 RepID=A0AAW0EFK8_9AGAR
MPSRSSSSSDPFGDDKGTRAPSSPPPPPAKPPKSSKPKDIVEEVRETVVVRGSPTRVSRSQTNAQPNPKSNTPQLAPRSVSQDAVPTEKSKKSNKKSSKHADVIDKLDFTGVGPMFHHDGPFDACAPSRNRQKSRAPMMAWGGRSDEPALPKDFNDNPYPSPNAYSAFSPTEYEPPKKKVDAIAEAWGIHEPEPYEEFFAGGGGGTTGNTPASSIYNGKESNRKPAEPTRPRAHARRSQLPPPMPIFVPDGVTESGALTDSPESPGSFPKRNKSLMHRIRKMRDSPNVPAATDDEAVTDGERPTHRSQNSFLGRLGGNNGRAANGNMSPTSETSESYVFIEPKKSLSKDDALKDLPPTPPTGTENGNGYFNESDASPPSGGGLGRKTSLMKKVGRVVRGTK